MKRDITIFILGIVTLFTSCSRERLIDETDMHFSVVFAMPHETATKAAPGHPVENDPILTDAGMIPVGSSFGVYGWEKPDLSSPINNFANLQNRQVFHSSSNVYTYSPLSYWSMDPDAMMGFMAYYPWTNQSATLPNPKVTSGVGTDRSLLINYTVSTDSGDHIDLMYAKTGMALGFADYDPVELVFRHALSRIMFEARIEDFQPGAIVEVTGIKLKNVVLKGDLYLLNETIQPGKPYWALSGASGDRGDITMPASHLNGITLTDAGFQSVMKRIAEGDAVNGDMLVLPQSLTGLSLEVTVSYDGRTPSISIPLDDCPDWDMNEITVYEIVVYPSTIEVTARVIPWNEAELDPGQFKDPWNLSVDNDNFSFMGMGGKQPLTITTDYPEGWMIVNKPGWISANPGVQSSPTEPYGTLVTLTAEPNMSGFIRFATLEVMAGNLSKIITVEQPPDPANVFSTTLTNSYVGAFWRASEIGERIILFNVTGTANEGDWRADVVWMDGRWSPGEIVLDTEMLTTLDLSGRHISFSSTASPYDTPDDAELYPLEGRAISVKGNVPVGGGSIAFRIGLKNNYYPTFSYPARYAVVLLTYGNPIKYQKIYLRQGEGADYLMRPGDLNGSLSYVADGRAYARMFLPYNLTAATLNVAVDIPGTTPEVNPGIPAPYPSQAGAFFQWAQNGTSTNERTRFAWDPFDTGANSSPAWNTTVPSGTWTGTPLAPIHETCPPGYRRPNDGSTSAAVPSGATNVNSSEMRQSLWLNPQAQTTSNTDNMVVGYYADGFFDRRMIESSSNYTSSQNVANAAVSVGNKNVAYRGALFFNPYTYASLFFPLAGYRNSTTNQGRLSYAGAQANYWASSRINTTTGNAWHFFASTTAANQANENEESGFSIRCVKGIENEVSSALLLYITSDGKLQLGRWGVEVNRDNLLHFKFGSVVGFTIPSGSNDGDLWAASGGAGATAVQFNPSDIPTSTFVDYYEIPYYSHTNDFEAGLLSVSGAEYHYGENVKAGKGDPCQLVGLTASQIKNMSASSINALQKTWRLPTKRENVDFVNAPTSYYTYIPPTPPATPLSLVNSNATYWGTPPGGGGLYSGGWFPIPGNRENTTGRTTRANNPDSFLPAVGYRGGTQLLQDAGVVNQQGAYGYFWSGTVYEDDANFGYGYALGFNNTNVYPASINRTIYGFAIRCVVNTEILEEM